MGTVPRDQWVFFGVVPVVLGLLMFSRGGPPASDVPSAAGLLFWVTAAPLWWAVLHAATLLVARITARLALPRWAILGAGSLLALPLVRALYVSIGAFYLELFGREYPANVAPLFELSWPFLQSMVWQAAWLWVSWIGLNCLLDYYIGQGRYPSGVVRPRQAGEEAAAYRRDTPARSVPDSEYPPRLADPTESEAAGGPAVPALPDFLRKVPSARRGDLIAIKAEDHYLKVMTSKGESLVHYRISDAIREMPEDAGIRVHRSHWVARDAIARCETVGRSLRLTLVNGTAVPVSQSYKQPVLQFCRAAGHDLAQRDD